MFLTDEYKLIDGVATEGDVIDALDNLKKSSRTHKDLIDYLKVLGWGESPIEENDAVKKVMDQHLEYNIDETDRILTKRKLSDELWYQKELESNGINKQDVSFEWLEADDFFIMELTDEHPLKQENDPNRKLRYTEGTRYTREGYPYVEGTVGQTNDPPRAIRNKTSTSYTHLAIFSKIAYNPAEFSVPNTQEVARVQVKSRLPAQAITNPGEDKNIWIATSMRSQADVS